MTAIKAVNTGKTYTSGFFKKRKTEALKGVSVDIEQGEIFGILGPNGAGKSTFMNILMGLITADTGTVTILGHTLDSHDFPMDLKRRMNMCSGNANLPWSLTVREILRFYSMIYNIKPKTAEKSIENIIAETGLEKYSEKRFDELSTGNKQKLSLAKALINDPDILLLDEPTLGLDPDISVRIRNYIKKIHAQRNVTVLLTTHYMKEAEELCGRIAFIRDGRITALGTADELKKKTDSEDMEAMFIELANQQD